MTTWLKMQPQDTLPVYSLMRAFYDRRLGQGTVPDGRLYDSIGRCCGDYPHIEGWVIYESGTLAGYAMLSRGYDPAEGKELMRMEEFYISPEYRQAGTAERFLRALPGLYPGCGSVSVPDNGADAAWRPRGYRRVAALFSAACPSGDASPDRDAPRQSGH